jgi:hypothetical protein
MQIKNHGWKSYYSKSHWNLYHETVGFRSHVQFLISHMMSNMSHVIPSSTNPSCSTLRTSNSTTQTLN